MNKKIRKILKANDNLPLDNHEIVRISNKRLLLKLLENEYYGKTIKVAFFFKPKTKEYIATNKWSFDEIDYGDVITGWKFTGRWEAYKI